MLEYVLALAAQYPQAAAVLMVIGLLRAVFKPLQLVVDAYVQATPDGTDDSKWAEIKESKWFKAIAWLLDYTASIKLPK